MLSVGFFFQAEDGIGYVGRSRGRGELYKRHVTNGDVAEAIESATKKEIVRRNVTVPDIHNLGSFTAKIKLHPEVNAEVNIEVTS